MWIRWSVRLLIAALIAVQTCIIAVATAASAAPVTPGDRVRPAPPPVIRTYEIEGVIETARWYAARLDQSTSDDLSRTRLREAGRISHGLAMGLLRDAGLRRKSSGHCTDRRIRVCTSLEAVRSATLHRVIELKRVSGCPIMVTGGTETGHAPGPFSHASGHKLDISRNRCVDRFVTGNYQPISVRGDGARLYRASDGTVFADESDHWDILFR